MRALPLCLACVLFGALTARADDPTLLRPVGDDVAVQGQVRLAPGVWRLTDANGNGVLRITTDGVTLDLGRATLVGAPEGTSPDAYGGVGILVQGARNVTIRNGRVRGFKIGVRAENAPGLVLEAVDASANFHQRLASTPEREAPADWLWPHHNDAGEWETRYGAGIALTDCRGARVERCTVRDGQNGLLLTRCERARVQNNDFSFNSGWGIALYRSRACTVAGNRCDWCVRGFSHGIYERGQDAAGILVFEQCCDNLFVGNSATHGGDGFFLYAGHETTERTGRGGSNGNVVIDNDFSHAVANGIEATFSEDNTFVRNDCSDADHGVWAGYSARTLIGGNRIDGCRTAGISIEHGQENRLVANTITSVPVGIHLWWDLDEAFVNGVFGRQHETASARNVIQGNVIAQVGTALRLVGDEDTTVTWNQLHAREVVFDLGAGTRLGTVRDNQLGGARLASAPRPLAVRDPRAAPWALPLDNERRGFLRGEGDADPMALPSSPAFLRPPLALPDVPHVVGARRARLPADMPRGRAQMRIGAWGPLDPRRPHVFPDQQTVPGPVAQVHLAGNGAYRILGIQGDVTVQPPAGDLPATLTVRVRGGDDLASSLVPFALRVEADGLALDAQGTLLAADWDVRWYAWTADPREDDAAFRALLAGPPLARAQVEALAYDWRQAGPAGVRPDRFATVARSVLRLPAGRYRLRTVSDDGVRVFVGERRVIDNWTHHGPTEDVAEIDLEAGEHAVRVEHFEIDGWAHLTLRVERAGD